MIIRPVKTHRITTRDVLTDVLDRYLPPIKNQSVVAVTSKIVALCEGRVSSQDKEELIKQEADYYLPGSENSYNVYVTIKNGLLVPTAGIDESNTKDGKVLWPANLQKSANDIRAHVAKSGKKVGVIITDSKTTPLRWGTTGVTLAHSGFTAINDYIGTKDIFGRTMEVTKANIADGLGAAAVLVMGEGKEQIPLAVIEDIPFVKFQHRNPTKRELQDMRIDIEDDLYAPLLRSVRWIKGDTGLGQ